MTESSRKIARQATSAVAHVAPEPEDDDPFFALALTGRLRFRSDSAPFIHSHPRRN